MNQDLTQAIERAEIRREIQKLLSGLTPETQRQLLADLLVALESHPETTQRGKAKEGALRSTERSKGTTRAGGGARTNSLLEALKSQAGIPIQELAMKVYGFDDHKAKTKVRALLWSLKSQGRVTNIGTGKWEVVARETA